MELFSPEAGPSRTRFSQRHPRVNLELKMMSRTGSFFTCPFGPSGVDDERLRGFAG